MNPRGAAKLGEQIVLFNRQGSGTHLDVVVKHRTAGIIVQRVELGRTGLKVSVMGLGAGGDSRLRVGEEDHVHAR